MHDIVIRGGTIIDGTGRAAFTGDVAIAGERIAEVGGKQGPARREIDATGLLVTPGWVDVHTHYDGQAMWDPLLGPSCWHGVTTTMFGNCGVGFAPVRPQHRGALMELMEGVDGALDQVVDLRPFGDVDLERQRLGRVEFGTGQMNIDLSRANPGGA